MKTTRLSYGFEVTPSHNEWALVVQASAGQDGKTPLCVTLAQVDGGVECAEVKRVPFEDAPTALAAAVDALTRSWCDGKRKEAVTASVLAAWKELSGVAGRTTDGKKKEGLWLLTETQRVLDGERPVALELADSLNTLHHTYRDGVKAANDDLRASHPHADEEDLAPLEWTRHTDRLHTAYRSALETHYRLEWHRVTDTTNEGS